MLKVVDQVLFQWLLNIGSDVGADACNGQYRKWYYPSIRKARLFNREMVGIGRLPSYDNVGSFEC